MGAPQQGEATLRALVTGCDGFIGSVLAARLWNLGAEVWGLDYRLHGEPALFRVPDERRLTISRLGKFLEGADAVFHLGCQNQECCEDPHGAGFYYNVNLTEYIANACHDAQVPLIFTGSVSVYGEQNPIFDTSEVMPVTQYAAQKLAAEAFILRANGAVLRLSNVYGPGMKLRSPYCGVIGKAVAAALDGTPFTVYAPGTAIRTYTYVDDVVDALLAALAKHEIMKGETAIVAGPDQLGALELAHKCGAQISVVGRRKWDTISRRQVFGTKMEALTGWRPNVGIEEGIMRLTSWALQTLPHSTASVNAPSAAAPISQQATS